MLHLTDIFICGVDENGSWRRSVENKEQQKKCRRIRRTMKVFCLTIVFFYNFHPQSSLKERIQSLVIKRDSDK